jgi:hypothetical protein
MIITKAGSYVAINPNNNTDTESRDFPFFQVSYTVELDKLKIYANGVQIFAAQLTDVKIGGNQLTGNAEQDRATVKQFASSFSIGGGIANGTYNATTGQFLDTDGNPITPVANNVYFDNITGTFYKYINGNYVAIRTGGDDVINGYWFGLTGLNTFTIPAPTSLGQNYYDFTTNTSYTAATDLSGWVAGTSVSPSNGNIILVTEKFWDITGDNTGGEAIYSDNGWIYYPNANGVQTNSVYNLNYVETLPSVSGLNVGDTFLLPVTTPQSTSNEQIVTGLWSTDQDIEVTMVDGKLGFSVRPDTTVGMWEIYAVNKTSAARVLTAQMHRYYATTINALRVASGSIAAGNTMAIYTDNQPTAAYGSTMLLHGFVSAQNDDNVYEFEMMVYGLNTSTSATATDSRVVFKCKQIIKDGTLL